MLFLHLMYTELTYARTQQDNLLILITSPAASLEFPQWPFALPPTESDMLTETKTKENKLWWWR